MRLILTVVLSLLSFSLLSQVTFNNCDSSRVQSFYVELTNGSSYNWSVNGGLILGTNLNRVTILFPDSVGEYIITVVEVNDNGCPGDNIKLIVESLPCEEDEVIWFPSAFTPNGDGINDIFNAIGEFKGDNYKLEIYNKWGELLFISENKEIGWDGTYMGNIVQDDMYVYRFFMKLNSNYFIKYGSITLFK